MRSPLLYISRDTHYDWLSALEYGRVSDGDPASVWEPVSEQFAFYRPPRTRRARGFFIHEFDAFDPEAEEHEAIWSAPRFDVPMLGQVDATAGEIALAARAYLGDEPTVNRAYFDMGTERSGEQALAAWRCCLESGDLMAHFALGYTLFELERFHEAYRHLRLYTELAPHCGWAWCWLGKAAAAIGETVEAERAYKRAIALTAGGGDETDAPELLGELLREHA